MTDGPAPPVFDAAAYAEAAAPAVGLVLDEATRPSVVANLERTHAFTLLFLDDPEVAATEPAPVFLPGKPSQP